MNKKNIFFEKWYIATIIVFILVLSTASWIQFIKGMVNTISYHYSDKNKTNVVSSMEINSLEKEEDNNNIILKKVMAGCSFFDGKIKKVDSLWSVYKKKSFSNIDSEITYYSLGEISSIQVIKGNDKWLFYASRTDGDVIADFEGRNKYTSLEMDRITESSLLMQNEMEKRNIEFAVLVVPNKENVYAEYMPEKYVYSDLSRTEELVDYMKNRGVNIVFPKEQLIENKGLQEYYYYDTHWNQLGAYVGVKETLLIWDINLPDISDRTIYSKELYNNFHCCAEDDLAKMVGLSNIFSDEKEYEINGTISTDWDLFESEQDDEKISHFHNDMAINDAKIFLVGDSFRTSMVPSLREQFKDLYVVHRSYYSNDMLDEINPDYLIVEYVERYSDSIEDIEFLVRHN